MPPSAGLGHRLHVQGAGREFAGRQDAIREEARLEADPRDLVPNACRATIAHVASAGSGHTE